MQVLQHSMLTDFRPRLYQEKIFHTTVKNNTLVVLPTGLGKTALAMMLAAHRLTLYPQSKIVFLAPTKPLVEQHRKSFEKHVNIAREKLIVFTGNTAPAQRAVLWKEGQIFFSTPQGFENDVMGSKIDLKGVSLMIFDEAHHATGEYSYNFIAEQYKKRAPFNKVLALTASPGADLEKIQEVCSNLSITAVEVRTEQDTDVKPYIQEKTVQQVSVELPASFLDIKKDLETFNKTRLRELQTLGTLPPQRYISKRELLGLQGQLFGKMRNGEKDFTTLKSISLVAELMKIQHAQELLESQGLEPLQKYLTKLQREANKGQSKAVQHLVKDSNYKNAVIRTEELLNKGIRHPKIEKLKEVLSAQFKKEPLGKCIVFTQFRDTASLIKKNIANTTILPELFVGQAKKNGIGLSQKKQEALLDQFRDGLFNTLIATSVAEEGLDIPSVNTIIFYEPIPSAIRTIQRSGRTGRHDEGTVIVLCAKGTRDEAYKWSAHHKEKRMYRVLDKLKRTLLLTTPVVKREEKSLSHYNEEKKGPTIYADYREKGSIVLKELLQNSNLQLTSLNAADYVLSSRVGVEIKKVPDFVSSLLDGRLLLQLKELKKNFDQALLIIEGEEDMYSLRQVHANAIRGMLATITASYGIPLLYTKNGKETASMLHIIAEREQAETGKNFSYHFEKRGLNDKEQQEYIISSLPNVGSSVAKALLNYFGSVQRVINATEEELKEVVGVGSVIAKGIVESVKKKY